MWDDENLRYFDDVITKRRLKRKTTELNMLISFDHKKKMLFHEEKIAGNKIELETV